jgi:hypothetical protein
MAGDFLRERSPSLHERVADSGVGRLDAAFGHGAKNSPPLAEHRQAHRVGQGIEMRAGLLASADPFSAGKIALSSINVVCP